MLDLIEKFSVMRDWYRTFGTLVEVKQHLFEFCHLREIKCSPAKTYVWIYFEYNLPIYRVPSFEISPLLEG